MSTSLPFFYLVMACPMTVPEAARRYDRSVRTIRGWCEDLRVSHQVGRGPHRISVPMMDLYACGERRALKLFLDGGLPGPSVNDAFHRHGVFKALLAYVRARGATTQQIKTMHDWAKSATAAGAAVVT